MTRAPFTLCWDAVVFLSFFLIGVLKLKAYPLSTLVKINRKRMFPTWKLLKANKSFFFNSIFKIGHKIVPAILSFSSWELHGKCQGCSLRRNGLKELITETKLCVAFQLIASGCFAPPSNTFSKSHCMLGLPAGPLWGREVQNKCKWENWTRSTEQSTFLNKLL